MSSSHRILHRYVLSEYLRILSLSLSSLIFIYLIVLFFQKMGTFTKNQAPLYLIFEYLLYKMPSVIFEWTLPFGVLLATLLTLGTFSRHSEITAMKANGISLYRITFPLLLLALILSLFSFLGNEYLVPWTNYKTKYVLDVKVRKEEPSSFFRNYKIWYHGDHEIFNIQLLDPAKKVLKGFSFYRLDDQFHCTQRIDAQEAKWTGQKWDLHNGTVRKFDPSGSIQTIPFKQMEISLQETWDSFQKLERPSEELSYSELMTYIRKIRSAGYDATRYVVGLHAKLSYPFLNLVMVLIGIPFALKTARSGGIALNIGISVVIGSGYAVLFAVFISFGKTGILPPLVAAWTPTVLFSLAGIFTLMSIRQ
jgi:lipopolysaccharide export system permease protein